jgi:hypothetical protein
VYISGLEVVDYEIVAQVKAVGNGDLRPMPNIRYTLRDNEHKLLYVVYQEDINDTNDTNQKQ